ncbi:MULTISPECIES: hypothetical protein [unclassified Streptomyces]|uniref:hypothetical protein n=1 Tax=unclassified Streptomyces TaxID=2593676 RepID=UPI0035D722FA
MGGAADDADRITVLSQGWIHFDGTTHGFLGNTPADTPGSRRAEAACTALTLQG